MLNIKYKELVKDILTHCDVCGERPEILEVYGEFERPLCSKCYISEMPMPNISPLPTVAISFGDETDLSGLVVGRAYYIAGLDARAMDLEPAAKADKAQQA